MSVTRTISSNAIAIRLNAGTSASGARITRTINLSGLKESAFTSSDDEAVIAIVNALLPCLSYGLYDIVHTAKSTLEED